MGVEWGGVGCVWVVVGWRSKPGGEMLDRRTTHSPNTLPRPLVWIGCCGGVVRVRNAGGWGDVGLVVRVVQSGVKRCGVVLSG